MVMGTSTHAQAVLVGDELHLRFDGEIGGVEQVGVVSAGREGPVAGLRVAGVDARGEAGGQVEEPVAGHPVGGHALAVCAGSASR